MKPFPSFKKSLAALLFASTLCGGANAADIAFNPSQDGVYAVFTTNYGEFAAKLYYDQTPLTVANFVGLAEGTVLRWDATEKEPIYGPYYQDMIFHRVIDGFMIQGGDPTGTGSGDPGYGIPDEMDPDLSHDRAGILSMANSGPNSGGSQFFITVEANPTNGYPTHLDGTHSIFGEIVTGMDVVEDIAEVEVNPTTSKPVADVVLLETTILRIGEEAKNFNPRDYDVPNVYFPSISFDETEKTATFPRKGSAYYFIWQSTDLEDWELDDESVVAEWDAPATHSIDISDDMENEGASFLRVTERTIPKAIDAEGTELVLSLNNNSDLTITIDADLEGTFALGESSGPLDYYGWFPLAEKDQLYMGFTINDIVEYEMQLYLTWTSETEGTAYAKITDYFYRQEYTNTGTFTANARPTE